MVSFIKQLFQKKSGKVSAKTKSSEKCEQFFQIGLLLLGVGFLVAYIFSFALFTDGRYEHKAEDSKLEVFDTRTGSFYVVTEKGFLYLNPIKEERFTGNPLDFFKLAPRYLNK